MILFPRVGQQEAPIRGSFNDLVRRVCVIANVAPQYTGLSIENLNERVGIGRLEARSSNSHSNQRLANKGDLANSKSYINPSERRPETSYLQPQPLMSLSRMCR